MEVLTKPLPFLTKYSPVVRAMSIPMMSVSFFHCKSVDQYWVGQVPNEGLGLYLSSQ